MTSMTPLEKKAIDTMRALAMDAVQQAKSGHPGAPMALAPPPTSEGIEAE